jgi:maltoporin
MRFAPCAVVVLALTRAANAQPEPTPDPPPADDDKDKKPTGGELGGYPGADQPPAPPTPPVKLEWQPPPHPEPPTGIVVPVDPRDGFRFGSYGRLIAGTDLRGGKPESANVVAFGPRIVEASYLELEFSYGFRTKSGKRLRPVITLAFDGTLFHDTGDFDAQPALRNMFLEAEVTHEVTAWVGSRMYRGDDIYLFDYWPLDDQNTVGGGVQFHKDALDLAVHGGVNRLDRCDTNQLGIDSSTCFQFQQIDVANPEQGATTVTQLNRQRLIASATAQYTMSNGIADPNFKLKLHGELHALPSGTRKRIDGTFEDLPNDTGFLVGAEAGTFGYAPSSLGFRRHLNVFMRYAKGLAAFDELAPPTSFGTDLETNRASELTFGASGNWDHELGNVMLGALSRRFIDADTNTVDHDDGWEYALDIRPLASLGNDFFAGADISYQARFPRGLNAITQRAEDPAVFQIAPMLVYSPMGPSAYDRPQLRFVYRAARQNEGARDLFVPDDPRRAYTWTHFLGFQAEWWFNSSTYR